MKKKYLPIFIVLFILAALLFRPASAKDYQGPINGCLQTIEMQVNKLPDWEKGFSLAKLNLDSLEQALANTSREIQEERKQNPNYTVEIKLYSATGRRMKELEGIKNDLKDYMQKLNDDYYDMNDAISKGRNIVINNIAKAMAKYFTKMGKPDITNLDVSGEKKDAITLGNNFKNIKNMNQLMNWNRKEFNRSKAIYQKAITMVNSLKPIDNKMNEILKKYANLSKVVSESEQINIPNVTGTWIALAPESAADGGRCIVQVATIGEKFHATCSYTCHGKQYSWTMDGKIDRQGKVAVVMTHSSAGKIPYTFQLSADGKKFSGSDINWVRP